MMYGERVFQALAFGCSTGTEMRLATIKQREKTGE
jgi:hypothetical protein